MKKMIAAFTVMVVLVMAVPAMATLTYTADLGATDVLSGVTLGNDWGEMEPETTGGGYGGFGFGGDIYTPPTTPTADHSCKMVWGNTASGDITDFATATFDTAITSIIIRHLDGISVDKEGNPVDSFSVYVGDGMSVNGTDAKWGSYTSITTSEYWIETTFNLPPGVTAGNVLTIDCTSLAGNYQAGYGQLGIDRFEATPIPEPATMCLLGLGGLLFRRRKNV